MVVHMKSRILFASTVATMLIACQGPNPTDNAQTSQPEAIEAANMSAAAVNESGENISTAEPALVADQPKSCEAEIGKKAAAELVRRCLNVSPATHPPCNAANSCEMIRQEINRSCAMFGDDKPADCSNSEGV
jgi:hypothetical protein